MALLAPFFANRAPQAVGVAFRNAYRTRWWEGERENDGGAE